MSLRERIPDANVWRVYWTTLALGLAYGIAISLIPLQLAARGFEKTTIGSLAAWFAGGIVLGSLPAGMLIRRLSAKWVLAASLAGYAVTVTAFPHLPTYGSIAAVRLFDGAFSVGVWVASETIVLTRTRSTNKAFATSLYAIAIAVGYLLGPLAARGVVEFAPLDSAFSVAGAVAAAVAAYVALRVERDVPGAAHGADPSAPAASSGSVLWRIKCACFATFAYGYFQASVVLFLPLFLMEERGIPQNDTILITAFFAAGMLLFSNVFGRIGDRVGHLSVMRVLAVIGGSMVLGFAVLPSFALMCTAVFVAGATLASISPLSLALQGVVTAPGDYSRATSFYNAFYAAGMLLGPPASSVLFARHGGAAMLLHLAALWLAFVAFTVLFRKDDPAARGERVAPARALAITGGE